MVKTANGYKVSFQGDKDVWKLIVVMIAQLYKYTKTLNEYIYYVYYVFYRYIYAFWLF